MSKRKSISVPIRNPKPGGGRYTSERTARRLVERGIAVLAGVTLAEGIRYCDEAWLRMLPASTARDRLEESINNDRNGAFFWNGADPNPRATHRPGENVLIPKPGWSNMRSWMAAQGVR